MASGKGAANKARDAFEERIGHKFRDSALLDRALRHPSVGLPDNQRLEFLGDRVLGLAISRALYEQFPEASEGELAPRYNYLIRKERCAEIAAALGMGEVVELGRAEARSGGRRKNALLGDAIEALIAAIFLDSDYAHARDFVLREWGPYLADLPPETVDAKTRLQEYAQARGETLPDYRLVDREGPDHAPSFTIEVALQGKTALGEGKSKRRAEQRAATMLLAKLEAK